VLICDCCRGLWRGVNGRLCDVSLFIGINAPDDGFLLACGMGFIIFVGLAYMEKVLPIGERSGALPVVPRRGSDVDRSQTPYERAAYYPLAPMLGLMGPLFLRFWFSWLGECQYSILTLRDERWALDTRSLPWWMMASPLVICRMRRVVRCGLKLLTGTKW